MTFGPHWAALSAQEVHTRMAINAYRLPAHVRDAADAWWSQDFSVDPSALRPATTVVQEHTGRLSGSTGIWILVTGEFPVISMPAKVFCVLRDTARGWSSSMVGDRAAIADAILPFTSTRVVGPAFIGYGTGGMLNLSAAERARPVSDSDALAVDALRAECKSEEWEHGGGQAGDARRFGAADEDGRLCSLASYVVWDRLAHVSVITRPSARGRGFGKAAVALAAKHAIEAGLVPQYRTLASNDPSMRLGQRIGFQAYGFSVSVRLA